MCDERQLEHESAEGNVMLVLQSTANGEFTPVVTSTPTMTVSQPSDETTMPAFPEDGMIFPEDCE